MSGPVAAYGGPPLPESELGTVVDLERHRGARRAAPAPAPAPVPAVAQPPGAGPVVAPVEMPGIVPEPELVETVQAMYLQRGLSLANPATAAAHQTALEGVLLLLRGAHAQGVVDDRGYATLRALMMADQAIPQAM